MNHDVFVHIILNSENPGDNMRVYLLLKMDLCLKNGVKLIMPGLVVTLFAPVNILMVIFFRNLI